MKREKRHGIERELSIKRIRSQKKYSILIVSVLLLTCILIQIGFQMSEGLKAAYIENRKAVYGEWEQVFVDMDESSVKVAEENPFLAQTGKISIYGAIAGDYLENRQMNIGTMDETAWNLGRLEMKEGRLTENEHEIVMEYSTLRSLGYEEMLGKEITLDITPALSILEQGESKSYSYTLCGILKDYQINWEICNRHRFPTGIVTQEGGNRIGSVQDMHMLVKAKEGSESVYKDLKDSEEFTCGMDDNVEQDKLSDVSLPYMDFLENIRLLIGGASICILFLTVSRSIISREQFWRFLDALGMRRGQMYQIIFWEAVLLGIGAVVVGNLAGIWIYQLVIPFFEKITGQTLPQAIAWEGVLFGTGFSVLCIGASYGLSAVQLRILLKEKKKKVQKRRGKYRKIVRFTPGRVLLHEWQMHRVRKSVEIVLLASALLIVGFGKMEISTRQEELKVYQRLTGNGYYLSTMEITNSPGISRQTVDKLEQVAGVTSVEQYHNNEKEEFWIDLSEYAESEYFQKVVETLVAYLNETSIKEKISIEKVRLSLLTIDRWQDIQRFLRNLDEGSLTKEEFEQGDFCILDLTELQGYDQMYFWADRVLKILENMDLDSVFKEAEAENHMGPGDYNYHNLLVCQEGMAVTGFEHAHRDVQMEDLYYFLRKCMEKHHYDERLGYRMMRAYDSVNNLGKKERDYLAIRLAYPEKFWKITNSYYHSGKAWIPAKNVEKLSLSVAQTEEKKRFLRNLFAFQV